MIFLKKYLFVLFILATANLNAQGQDTAKYLHNKLQLSLDILSWFRNSVEVTGQFNLNKNISFFTYLGYSFKTPLTKDYSSYETSIKNTSNVFMEGNFFGFGAKLYGLPFKKFLPFIGFDVCWSAYNQTADFIIPTYYGIYTEKYTDEGTVFGYQLLSGISYCFFPAIHFETGIRIGVIKVNPDNPFNHFEYNNNQIALLYPGFGRTWTLLDKNHAMTFNYILSLNYKFPFRKKIK